MKIICGIAWDLRNVELCSRKQCFEKAKLCHFIEILGIEYQLPLCYSHAKALDGKRGMKV